LLNAPPETEIDFKFTIEEYLPMAMATLKEDQNLNTARFALVPKSISEHEFWRNYFYRIHVIKQAFGLTGQNKVKQPSSLVTPAIINQSTAADALQENGTSDSVDKTTETNHVRDQSAITVQRKSSLNDMHEHPYSCHEQLKSQNRQVPSQKMTQLSLRAIIMRVVNGLAT